MPIKCDPALYSVVREEHMIHNDFFLRYLEFEDETLPSRLTFTCLASSRELVRIHYGPEETTARLAYSREELPRYRDSSLSRILGLDYRPSPAFLHEHFSFFASQAADELRIEAACGRTVETSIPIIPYQSPNRWRFPLRGTVLVTDTYSSINSHRWCRNSEFAFDAGAFDEALEHPTIGGSPVFAACDGIVEAVFDGLEDTNDRTDLDQIERKYGEGARIDGNHVLLRHGGGELSLYAHLEKCQRQFKIERKRRRNFVIFRRGGGIRESVITLHEKSVYDLLFLAHKFLALLQAVRLTLDVDHGTMVQNTVQDSGGDGNIGKDLVPLGEGLVGGKDGGRFFIPYGNELEEQIGALDVHREITNLVNDEHLVLGQHPELVRQAVLKVGLFELFMS